MKTQEIQIRDPFVVARQEDRKYYLFGSTDKNIWGPGTGFDVYVGSDLVEWEGPFPAFRPGPDFWSNENFWAPEVHEYQGLYYMLATFKRRDNGLRGTAILVADDIMGPYLPHSDGPVTPKDWLSLDGTLHVDDEGNPWLVFAHEWVQVRDGEICAVPLSADLRNAIGEPVLLFRASQAPWVTPKSHHNRKIDGGYVTDGPFLTRTEAGSLLMLWSSFILDRYAIGVAISTDGQVANSNWIHEEKPLYTDDGGHGMLFCGFEGQWYLAIHSPNRTPDERPLFLPVVFDSKRVILA